MTKKAVVKPDGFQVDQQKIADAISLLTTVYNVPNEKQYHQALDLVERAALSDSKILPVRADLVKPGQSVFYASGVKWLDEWMGGGVRKKEVIFIGAMPYTGKTHLAAWWAGNYGLQGANIAHFYAEDLEEDVRDYYQAVGGKALLKKVWLINMQDYVFTVQQAGDVLHKLSKDGTKIDVAVFDHMDVMHHSGPAIGGDWQDAAGVAREIKVLTGREDVIGIALSQAHEKSKEQKGIGRFYRAKIGKSGNADIIVILDSVVDDEYHLSREKARGRRVTQATKQKVLQIDWDKLEILDIT